MKIIQNYKDCIGCGTCAVVCPKFWEMNNENKAQPKNFSVNAKTGDYEVEIEEKEIGCNREAEESCPVSVIKIS